MNRDKIDWDSALWGDIERYERRVDEQEREQERREEEEREKNKEWLKDINKKSLCEVCENASECQYKSDQILFCDDFVGV